MQVTFLGTGSALPSPERVQSSSLLKAADRRLLVDCGSGTLHRAAQAGVDPGTIETVLLTHHHLDHVADLPSLVKAGVLTDNEQFQIAGPPGTQDVVRDLLTIDDLHERAAISVRELEIGEFELAGFEIQAHETRHSAPCLAYRVDDRVGFSGDTEPFPALAEFFDGVDVLLHECAYPDGADAVGHATPTALGEHLADHDIDRLYLTHLFPDAEARDSELVTAVERNFDGEVTVATDGTQLSL